MDIRLAQSLLELVEAMDRVLRVSREILQEQVYAAGTPSEVDPVGDTEAGLPDVEFPEHLVRHYTRSIIEEPPPPKIPINDLGPKPNFAPPPMDHGPFCEKFSTVPYPTGSSEKHTVRHIFCSLPKGHTNGCDFNRAV